MTLRCSAPPRSLRFKKGAIGTPTTLELTQPLLKLKDAIVPSMMRYAQHSDRSSRVPSDYFTKVSSMYGTFNDIRVAGSSPKLSQRQRPSEFIRIRFGS